MLLPGPRTPFFLLAALTAVTGCLSAQSSDPLRFFEEKVRPVLAERCYQCHSGRAATPFAGLRLDSREAAVKGGDSGPALIPGNPDQSRMIRAVRHQTTAMPPGAKLPDHEIEALVEWVRIGAPWPEEAVPAVAAAAPAGQFTAEQMKHWAWQPLSKPAPPATKIGGWTRDPLDAYVLAALESAGMKPNPEADRRTWLRRVSYDLTGLPPTAEEVDRFAADKSPGAYERIADRLLASPHFGERWARYWLDVARFAEAGFGNNRFPYAFAYRDWVIRAYNQDLPYDRFVTLQLAADHPEVKAKATDRAALGLLSLGTNNPRATAIADRIDDRIDTVTRGMLGLTVSCARCHDHKYDPIPTRDYYSLYGVFLNSREPAQPAVLSAKAARPHPFYEKRLAERWQSLIRFQEQRLEVLRAEAREPAQVAKYLLAAHEGRHFTNPQFENLSSERNLNHYLLVRWKHTLEGGKGTAPVWTAWHLFATLPAARYERSAAALARWLPDAARRGLVHPAIAEEFSRKAPASVADLAGRYAKLLAAHDQDRPDPDAGREALRLALRGPDAPPQIPFEDFAEVQTEGDYNTSNNLRWRYERMAADYGFRGGPLMAKLVEDSSEAAPAHVLVRGNLNDKGDEVERRFLRILCTGDPEPFGDGSGRLDLAREITRPDNPLTARVYVNRVWAHLFGEGIVRTVSDFGLRGDAPTHPELLDYLAREFMAGGWSTKKLIRRIVLSAAYRQSSADNEAHRLKDPENRLLWRMNRRRLDFEALRDGMLAVAGTLDRTIGGRSISVASIPAEPRRTLYTYVEREKAPALLKSFNFADPEQHTPQRHNTTVPQQALFLMNSPFVVEQARHAVRRARPGPATDEASVGRLYRTVLSRDPDAAEIRLAQDFVASRPKAAPPAAPANPWRYGTGRLDAEAGRLLSFEPFAYFSTEDDAWQGASLLPATEQGGAMLTATGGAPGDDLRHAVVRRWVAPVAGKVKIRGTFSQRLDAFEQRFRLTDGVRGWVIAGSSRLLGSWTIDPPKEDKNAEEFREVAPSHETNFDGIEVQAGDTIDFIVDSRGDFESDDFLWAPEIELEAAAGAEMPARWSAADQFRGPRPEPLRPWEELAQVLLLTNEFSFLD